jgi:hypothetical protein
MKATSKDHELAFLHLKIKVGKRMDVAFAKHIDFREVLYFQHKLTHISWPPQVLFSMLAKRAHRVLSDNSFFFQPLTLSHSAKEKGEIVKDVELKLIYELIKNSRRSDRELARVLKVSQPTVSRMINCDAMVKS